MSWNPAAGSGGFLINPPITMNNDHHPITPPLELVQQWRNSGPANAAVNNAYEQHIATKAARWGADAQLELCCEWNEREIGSHWHCGATLRAAMRPKPPSLKEQALGLLNEGPVSDLLEHEIDTIRRALEALPE